MTISDAEFRNYLWEKVERRRKLLPGLLQEWEIFKSISNSNFLRYTEEKILELKYIMNPINQEKRSVEVIESTFINIKFLQSPTLLVTRADELISQLNECHFTNKVDLDFILEVEKGEHKIRYFIEYMGELSDSDYWKMLSYVHLRADYSNFPNEILKTLFSSNRKEKEMLMNPGELELLNLLPEKLLIFRGMSKKEYESGNFNISWTLNKEKAEFFANRNDRSGKIEQFIHELEVDKKDIIAYLIGRGEDEIIYIKN